MTALLGPPEQATLLPNVLSANWTKVETDDGVFKTLALREENVPEAFDATASESSIVFGSTGLHPLRVGIGDGARTCVR